MGKCCGEVLQRSVAFSLCVFSVFSLCVFCLSFLSVFSLVCSVCVFSLCVFPVFVFSVPVFSVCVFPETTKGLHGPIQNLHFTTVLDVR